MVQRVWGEMRHFKTRQKIAGKGRWIERGDNWGKRKGKIKSEDKPWQGARLTA